MDPSQEVALLRMQVYSFQAVVNELRSRIALMEDDDVLPWPRVGEEASSGATPTAIGVNGTPGTITGSYSTSTPYLWFNYAANTAEWMSSTIAPFPLDTIILHGLDGHPSTFWYMK